MDKEIVAANLLAYEWYLLGVKFDSPPTREQVEEKYRNDAHFNYVVNNIVSALKHEKENRIVCEICGARAKHMIFDTRPNPNFGREPFGPPHYFCDEHVREPIEWE